MASSTIIIVFGMTRPKIETRSPVPLVNTLLIRPMARCISIHNNVIKSQVLLLRTNLMISKIKLASRTRELLKKYRYKETLQYHHHHHHAMAPARVSLSLSHHSSLSFIASGRSLGLHPVSSQSCCMYVWAGRPAFPRPYMGVHRSTSLMSSK